MIELIKQNAAINLETEQKEITLNHPVTKGDKGEKGDTGASAYEVAVNNGFEGTEKEWLESLKGKDGKDGANAALVIKSMSFTNDWDISGMVTVDFFSIQEIALSACYELPQNILVIDFSVTYEGNEYFYKDLLTNFLINATNAVNIIKKPKYDDINQITPIVTIGGRSELYTKQSSYDAISDFTIYYIEVGGEEDEAN